MARVFSRTSDVLDQSRPASSNQLLAVCHVGSDYAGEAVTLLITSGFISRYQMDNRSLSSCWD